MNGDDDDVRLVCALLMTGGVWQVESVQQRPESVLRQWQVYELEDGARHLVGWCVDACEGRATSAVAVFDAKTRSCRTASGRVYELRGPSGFNGDANYVWGRWRQLNGVSTCREVTAEVEQSLAKEGYEVKR